MWRAFALPCFVVYSTVLFAQLIDNQADDIYDQTGISEKFGQQLPLDLTFTAEDGQPVQLKSLFHQNRPVILVLAYYECPMLCTLVLNGLQEALPKVDLEPGVDYDIITVSIDHEETAEMAAAKRDRYLATLGKEAPPDAWRFLVGEKEAIRELADSVGFRFTYDAENDQYAHAAVLHLVTPGGRLSRYLYGIKFDPRDIRLGLLEASQGEIGSFVDRILLYCYHYDPKDKGYRLMAENIMRLGGAVTLLVLGSFLGVLWYREKHRPDDSATTERHQDSTTD